MGLSDQDARTAPLWVSTIRNTRRAVQIPERELEQKENALRAELGKLPIAACPPAILQSIERTLYQSEADVRERLLKMESAYRQANIELKLLGLDALVRENNAFWQEVANSLDALAHTLKSQGEQIPADAHKPDSKRGLPPLPESNFERIDAISRVAGRDSDIDLLLRSLGNVMKDYTQRKRRRRIVLVGARVLLFLGLVFLADGLLNLVQPFEFYLLAAVIAWFLDEYFIRPALDKRFEEWNVRALEQTIGDFYRAQRRALYLTAALENQMRKANAVLDTAET